VPAARFVIEKIAVEGVKHGSQKIVAAETLLTLGGSYTEQQLQEALHRVERLPFVVQADFSLRRGSERGRFELVITITETMPIFFGGTFDLRRLHSSYSGIFEGGTFADLDYSVDRWRGQGRPAIGGRLFFGDHSEVSAALTGSLVTPDAFDPSLSLAYTHHNLFGRHIVGSASLNVPLRSSYYAFDASAQLAFPLSTADAFLLQGALHVHNPLGDYGRTFSSIDASWQHDTTDDPFVPRRGTRSQVSVGYSTGAGLLDRSTVSGSLQISHYWPLMRRLSFGATVSLLGFDDVKPDAANRWGASATGGARLIGIIPWGRPAATHYWWELGVSSSYSTYRDAWADLPGLDFSERSTGGTLSASISGRGRWGTVRLTLRYEYSRSRISQ
jgi:outer membrane protein assembly factor BamA